MADEIIRILVISGGAGPPAAWQVNLNKRTPELERAHLAIRHLPAGRQVLDWLS
jgi:hypothetical protein